jgi:F-type H+-transporting ATPase subunit b
MVNLDYTLFIQMVNFIVLVILLNAVIFKPILKLFDERNEKVEGAVDEARRLSEEAEKLMEEYERKISEARQQALQLVNEGRLQAVDSQKKALAKVRGEAEGQLKQLKERVDKEKGEASRVLERFAQVLSISIAECLLGRPLDSRERTRWES